MPENEVNIRPQSGKQELFLSSPADVAIYGGTNGAGKTYALLLEPLRHINNQDFGAVFFRRTYPQITGEGALWDDARKVYSKLNSQSSKNDMRHTFPSGARVSFRHLQYEKDIENYQGTQIALLCFDQLEQFTANQFFGLLARNRSVCGIQPYCRATCNPDADSWLAEFISWWIADDGYADVSRCGIIRYFIRLDEQITWADTRQELIDKYSSYFERVDVNPNDLIKSATFIYATIFDNPALLEANPAYLANLMSLPLVERERRFGDPQRGGNWKIKHEAGKVFNRSWFEIVNALPAGGVECRFWDFAATVKKSKGQDPDYTAGVKILKAPNGYWYIADCINVRTSNYDNIIVNTAKQDIQKAKRRGAQYQIRWEIEPGSSGKRESARIAQLLAGFDARGVRPQGDKVQRAGALAAQAETNNVKVLTGDWNEILLKQLHGFPDAAHDDIVDASSGAFNSLASGFWFISGVQ